MSENSLVLLDELGAGTDPTEGASLAMSISTYIKESKAKAIITTHYNELKEYAVVTERCENASMDFNPVTYNPTYKLIVGTPGASNALLIARKLGLKESIVAQAQAGIQDGKLEFENVLQALEIARRKAVENEEQTAILLKKAEETQKSVERERDRLYVQRERLNENVRKETKRLVEDAMEEANEIIKTLRDILDEPTEQNLFKARKLRKSLEKYIILEDNEFEGFGEEDEGEIKVGDIVLVKALKVEGEVVEISKNTAVVRLGKMNSNFKLDGLQKLKGRKKEIKKEVVPTTHTLRNEAFSPELMLIG
ncbi:MAG: endonuclease MutS2, partial [Clostridia bacterium]|nr:endonuclease MutS2 [Clostridia bacterium]